MIESKKLATERNFKIDSFLVAHPNATSRFLSNLQQFQIMVSCSETQTESIRVDTSAVRSNNEPTSSVLHCVGESEAFDPLDELNTARYRGHSPSPCSNYVAGRNRVLSLNRVRLIRSNSAEVPSFKQKLRRGRISLTARNGRNRGVKI